MSNSKPTVSKAKASRTALSKTAASRTRVNKVSRTANSNVSQTTVVRDAWSRGKAVTVHGWVYDIRDGLLKDLGMCVAGEADLSLQAEVARAASA